MHNLFLTFCILYCAFVITGCNVPSLESTECAEARTVIKQFYSFHFGNDMAPSLENLKLRERYLTGEYFSQLVTLQNAGIDLDRDPFTPWSEKGAPKTFKIGQCNVHSEKEVYFQVQFYWRDDYSTDQKEWYADMEKANGVWLLRHAGTGVVP